VACYELLRGNRERAAKGIDAALRWEREHGQVQEWGRGRQLAGLRWGHQLPGARASMGHPEAAARDVWSDARCITGTITICRPLGFCGDPESEVSWDADPCHAAARSRAVPEGIRHHPPRPPPPPPAGPSYGSGHPRPMLPRPGATPHSTRCSPWRKSGRRSPFSRPAGSWLPRRHTDRIGAAAGRRRRRRAPGEGTAAAAAALARRRRPQWQGCWRLGDGGGQGWSGSAMSR
jgi:hypothetical protein